jgi:endonuclease/exonuclease/phosphatase family metal-dependent hydrolase
VRVVTFNILNGRSPEDGRVDVARFAATVRDLDPDLLALQEVDRGQARSGNADLTAVAAAAMGAVAHHFVAALAGTAGGSWVAATGTEQPDGAAYGVALLSRYPVDSWQVVRLAPIPRRVPYRFHGARRPTLVRDEPRVAAVAALTTPIGRLTVASTHLSFLPVWNLVQLGRLRRALPPVGPLLLAGDLNMRLRAAVRASRLSPAAAAPTFPAHGPSAQIDHLLTRGLPPPVSSAARRTALSDHCALLAEW